MPRLVSVLLETMIIHLSYERVQEVGHTYLDQALILASETPQNLVNLWLFARLSVDVVRLVNHRNSYKGFPCSFKNTYTFESEIANSVFPLCLSLY